MNKFILAAIACTTPLYAAQAQQVTYSWTTTSQGYGAHVSQPTTATFQVPLSAVQSGQINYSDISNIQLAYPGLTFDSFTPTSNGLDFAAFVDPTTGAFIFHDINQGLGVVGYQGGLFSDTFLSITIDNPYSPFGQPLTSVADQYNALNQGSPYAGFPTAGYWTASFGAIQAVPEPTTWAMMIAGFAGIGLAIRRRRNEDRWIFVFMAGWFIRQCGGYKDVLMLLRDFRRHETWQTELPAEVHTSSDIARP